MSETPAETANLQDIVVKNPMKALAGRVNIDWYQQPLAYALLRSEFGSLGAVPVFENRETLWERSLSIDSEDSAISYVEFGVAEGYSIRYIAGKNRNPNSIFIGLDSFEGLPESWGGLPAGTFGTGGRTPQIEDPRVRFIKGWFQDTLMDVLPLIDPNRNLIVHYDADLYSSTLFALYKIDSLGRNYLAIFDEFAGDETRALYNFLQASGASVKFIGKTLSARGRYPEQVLCEISPRSGDVSSD